MKLKKLLRKYDWTFLLGYMVYAVCVLAIIWIIASWFNVLAHNSTDHIYWQYNFFRIFWR